VQLILLDHRATIDQVGFIPSFLDEDDPRPAAQQLDANYQHGGGWRPQKGFTYNPKTGALHYPGDPPFTPIALLVLRKELILIYQYGYVAVVQPDGSFEACRMD